MRLLSPFFDSGHLTLVRLPRFKPDLGQVGAGSPAAVGGKLIFVAL